MSIYHTINESKPAFAVPLQNLGLRLRNSGEICNFDIDDTREIYRLLQRYQTSNEDSQLGVS